MVWEGYTVYVRYWTQLRAACGPVVTAVVGIPWRCGVMYAGHADYILLWLSVRTGLIQVESKTDSEGQRRRKGDRGGRVVSSTDAIAGDGDQAVTPTLASSSTFDGGQVASRRGVLQKRSSMVVTRESRL